ncbi:MAG: 1-acyl-sn-glycerol-3-phosphate acyltransferase [Planctomycetes bacterium]|nr:1-acyl-sn-glycerol-3-phosphate acyltransferase [Planctomycetota bacterium]
MTTAIAILAAVLAWAVIARWIMDNPRNDPRLGWSYRAVQAYARLFHRVRVIGKEHIPPRGCGPLVVVCNHTAGVDPALVQSACTFEIRWMMAKDMMLPRYQPFWEWMRIIGVDRYSKRDTASAREAIRHLEEGGVLGVFPEGGIEKPRKVLRPFMAGVGLIVAKTAAPVMPVFIDETPNTQTAWGSLFIPSRSKIVVGPPMRFETGARPEAIAKAIQDWFTRTSGWPTGAAE